ncbi:SET and MYND domain containing class 4 member 2 [Carabus blaptoides fortunei]
MCSERTLQSDTNGFFLQFADHVVNFAGTDWLNQSFAKIQSDRGRIETLFHDTQIKDIVCDTLSNVQCIYRKKDAKVSRDKRQDAELFMKKGNATKALVLYCQSILRAPAKGVELLTDAGKSLALSLWGRSQALMELGELTAALADLQLALKEGLPDKHRPELYLRMSACYKGQGEMNRAKVALALAEKLYGKNQADYKKSKESMTVGQLKAKQNNRKVMPELSSGLHEDIDNASSLLSLKETVDLGRLMVARKEISTGDTLVVESPRAACLLPECFGTHCHHCFQRLVAPVGCPDCASLAFCSVDCRDKALQTYHKYECKILDMLIGSGMSILCHVALRIVTQDGLARCLDIHKDKTLDPAQTLCRHSDLREPKDFLQRSLMAAFLLRCLQKCNFFPNKKEMDTIQLSEEEIQVAEILLSLLQILQFNAHEIYETRHGASHRFRTAKSAYIGVGLYPTVALFNHDCYPGVIRYYVDRNIVIKAQRPLKPGEIVSENYGPIFLKKNLADRQRSLMSRYWFKCHCMACTENWPGLDKLQNKHARLRCPSEECDYRFSQPVQENLTCPRCKKKVSFKRSLEMLEYCEKQYEIAFDAMEAQQPETAIKVLPKAIDMFHSIACPPHKTTHMAQESLRTCLADTGNVYECLVSSST